MTHDNDEADRLSGLEFPPCARMVWGYWLDFIRCLSGSRGRFILGDGHAKCFILLMESGGAGFHEVL
jgi:hypothetical protein